MIDRNPRCPIHDHPSWHREGLHNYCDRCGTEVDLLGHDVDALPNRARRRRTVARSVPATIRIWRTIEMGSDAECWPWTGHTNTGGYGQIGEGTRDLLVHRIVCEMAHGPIPDGYEVDHLCKVRHCCNPFHLEAVPKAENNRRSNSISARHARKAYCIRGHELTEENLAPDRGKGRQCKLCVRIVSREGYYRRKAARASGPREL